MTEQQMLAYSPAPPALPASPLGESPAIIDLPHPDLDGGTPLMIALAARMRSREFAATPLPLATPGAMMWAADGVNHPASGGRPAPSRRTFRYIAAAGLGTVVRGWINHRALADALRLNEDERPILAQTVGYRAGGSISNE